MFVHGAVAKLQQYVDEPYFQRAIDEIKAAQEEGQDNFSIEVQHLTDDEIMDLSSALEALGYATLFDNDGYVLNISYE